MKNHVMSSAGLAFFAAIFAASLTAGESPASTLEIPVAQVAPAQEFDYSITDGLYATVTAMQSFKKPELRDEKKFILKHIDGFKKEMPVRVLLQPEPAPLAVIFLGLTSRSKDPLARLWQSQLFEAGCHVLVFDSMFRSSFNEKSGHGVAGHMEMEAWLAANIIRAFLDHPEVSGKVTKVGLVGTSYGGILALNFAKLAKEGRVKVVPDRVLVFSPPVSMQISAMILDKFYDEDRRKHGLLEMFKLKGAEPQFGKPVPFSQSLMRAGIGYVFHEDLADAVACSKSLYNFELPEPPKDEKKANDKNQRQFVRFIEQVVYPYWQKNKRVNALEDLWAYGDLYKLLQAAPDSVHCVLTADDPLNDPILLKYIQRDIPHSKLTVLPCGGHLGYVGCKWSHQRVLQLFK